MDEKDFYIYNASVRACVCVFCVYVCVCVCHIYIYITEEKWVGQTECSFGFHFRENQVCCELARLPSPNP